MGLAHPQYLPVTLSGVLSVSTVHPQQPVLSPRLPSMDQPRLRQRRIGLRKTRVALATVDRTG
jgi:hypothetical protein